MSRIKEYSNDDITVFWNFDECIHSTICYTKLRKVFDPRKRPWINMSGASTEKIIDIVNQCPTSALEYKWKNQDDTKIEEIAEKRNALDSLKEEKSSTTIKLLDEGPIIIKGDFNLVDKNGKKLTSADTVSLCRCNKSKTMPYCDGSHRY